MTLPAIQGTTACYPGFTARATLDRLTVGVFEPVVGTLSTHHAQVCQQKFGVVTEFEALRSDYAGPSFDYTQRARAGAPRSLGRIDGLGCNATVLPCGQRRA